MIDYKLFQYAAPPFTGEEQIIRIAQLGGLGPGFTYQAHVPFQKSSGVKITVVRHPCNWLADCHYALTHGLAETNHIGKFRRLNCSSFDSFIHNYLETMEGGIWKLFCQYQASMAVKMEDLPNAFVEFLSGVGVPDSLIKNCRAYKGRPLITAVRWDKQLREAVIRSEREMCDVYDYF